jgi:hypothetical protein
MKAYHWYFIFLRILVILQVIFVILKKNIISPDIKLIIDTLVKLSLGLFLILFFFLNIIPGVEFWDTYILQFVGVFIILDIDFAALLKIIGKTYPGISKHLSFLETIQRAKHN